MSKIETFKKLMDSNFKKGNKRQLSFLTKAAKEVGIKIPKHITSAKATERQMNSFASKIMKAIKNSGVDTSIIPKQERTLNSWNKIVKETGNYSQLQDYIRKSKGSGTELMQVVGFLFFAKDKNKFTMKDLGNMAKRMKIPMKELIKALNNVSDNLSFNNDLKDILRFYGFKEKEVERVKDLYNKANLIQKDYMLKIFGNFGKGVGNYKEQNLAAQFGTKEFLEDKIHQILVQGATFKKDGTMQSLKVSVNKFINNYNIR